jgi:hypothetical protein
VTSFIVGPLVCTHPVLLVTVGFTAVSFNVDSITTVCVPPPYENSTDVGFISNLYSAGSCVIVTVAYTLELSTWVAFTVNVLLLDVVFSLYVICVLLPLDTLVLLRVAPVPLVIDSFALRETPVVYAVFPDVYVSVCVAVAVTYNLEKCIVARGYCGSAVNLILLDEAE